MLAFSHKKMLWLVLVLLMAGQMGETLYLPAMPTIVLALDAPMGAVQFLLSAFLLSFGAAQFIYGPLSDYYGRRPVMLVCLGIFLMGSIVATCAHTITVLIAGMFIMGTGIGCAGLMCRTVIRDLYSDEASLSQATAIMSAAVVIMPIVAPVLGAYLLVHIGWRANFAVFLIVGVPLTLLSYYAFQETNRYVRQTPLSFHNIYQNYAVIFKHPVFIGNTLCGCLNIGALMAYEVGAPFLFQVRLGLSPTYYAWVSLIPVGGFLLGAFIAGHYRFQLNQAQMSHLGNRIACVASALLFIPVFTEVSILGVIAPMTLLLVGSGILFSSTTAAAMAPFARLAGVAGATLGGLQNISSGLTTAFMSYYEIDDLLTLSCVLFFGSMAAYAVFIRGNRHVAVVEVI